MIIWTSESLAILPSKNFRVLNQVDFAHKFANLPAFTPDKSGTNSLPATPSALLRNMLEKQKHNNGGDNLLQIPTEITQRSPKLLSPIARSAFVFPTKESTRFFFGPNFSPDNVSTKNDAEMIFFRSRLMNQIRRLAHCTVQKHRKHHFSERSR